MIERVLQYAVGCIAVSVGMELNGRSGQLYQSLVFAAVAKNFERNLELSCGRDGEIDALVGDLASGCEPVAYCVRVRARTGRRRPAGG